MTEGKLFRAEDWWIGKASMLMGIVYMLSSLFYIRFDGFWLWAVCSIATIIGFASLGYLLNDYFDQEKDKLAGKKNFILHRSAVQKAGFFLIAFILLATPWYCLPHDSITLGLIAAQLIAYLLYSMPPVRLKERGISGIVLDALYAHSIPAVMATYTYCLISGHAADMTLFVLIFFWQFVTGVRNVLLHQQSDMENDARSGTATYLTAEGHGLSERGLFFIRALELFLLIALLVYFVSSDHLNIIPLAAVALSAIFCMQMSPANGYRAYYPNIVYDQWLPYAFIAVLMMRNIRFAWLLPVHGLLFSREICAEVYGLIPLGHYREVIRGIAVAISDKVRLTVNWIIYLVFRLFCIDLIKEKTDAKGYILRRINKQHR